MKRWNLCAVSLTAVMLAACGGGAAGNSTGPGNPGGTTGGTPGGTPGGTNNTNQVTMVDQTFMPGTVTVPVGTTVTWTWPTCDTAGGYGTCITHSVIFDDGSGITSPEQSQGTFARTFSVAGTFKYHCGVHGQAMNGQVVVQ
jgi:plastocyanin